MSRAKLVVLAAVVAASCRPVQDLGDNAREPDAGTSIADAGANADAGAEGAVGDGGATTATSDVARHTIALGEEIGCAILAPSPTGGAVRCWEQQTAVLPPTLPHAVPGLPEDVVALAAGSGSACAITAGRSVHCWEARGAAARVTFAPADVVEMGIGGTKEGAGLASFWCARTGAGEVLCWGSGKDGTLGPGGPASSATPVKVEGVRRAKVLAVGADHACVVEDAGRVHCWGDDFEGQRGDGSIFEGASKVAAGYASTAAIVSGEVRAWGVVPGTTPASPGAPRAVAGTPNPAAEIAVGEDFFCAVAREGAARAGAVTCWGRNASGQCGAPPIGQIPPTLVAGLPLATEIVAAGTAACARVEDGRVFCWGAGPLGTGVTSRATPAPVLGVP